MTNLTLRHYNVTLAYRTRRISRSLNSFKLHLRLHISLRKFRAQLRTLLPLRLLAT